MSKQPEEGRIWEWRAFGQISETLGAKVRAYPVRFSDVRGEDIYLISPRNDQNVKLRLSAGGCALKLKFLCEAAWRPFELYRESAEFTYQFPVSLEKLRESADLLEVVLPAGAVSQDPLDASTFVKLLAESEPPVAETIVIKKRSQYQFEQGWLELADIKFARRDVQSISVHSRDLDVVRKMVEQLEPGDELEVMNYIEACRRWR